MCRKFCRLHSSKKKMRRPKHGFWNTVSKATTDACSYAVRSAIRESRRRGFKVRPSREPTWPLFQPFLSTFTDSTITSRSCALCSTAFSSTRERASPKTCAVLPHCTPNSSKSGNFSTNSTHRAKSGNGKSKCIRSL